MYAFMYIVINTYKLTYVKQDWFQLNDDTEEHCMGLYEHEIGISHANAVII